MIIECTNCRSKYQYNEDRFDGKASKKIKCAKCGTIFEIFNPAFAPAAAPAAVAAPASTPVSAPPSRPAPAPAPAPGSAPGEQTFHKKPQPKPKVEESTAESSVPAPAGPASATLQMPAGKRLSLAVIDGPDAGNVFRIEKPRVTIGRAGADLNLNDTEASRQHAAVEIRDTAYSVLDLGSTNGTLVDGVKITGPTDLVDKGEFVVGNSTVMLIVTEDV